MAPAEPPVAVLVAAKPTASLSTTAAPTSPEAGAPTGAAAFMTKPMARLAQEGGGARS